MHRKLGPERLRNTEGKDQKLENHKAHTGANCGPASPFLHSCLTNPVSCRGKINLRSGWSEGFASAPERHSTIKKSLAHFSLLWVIDIFKSEENLCAKNKTTAT